MNGRSELQRHLLLIAGDADWCAHKAAAFIRSTDWSDVHWFGDHPPAGVPASQGAGAFQLLGSELDLLVFDAWSGFDPDAFGALAGTVRGGGWLLLLAPSLDSWPAFDDPQNRRITVAPYAPGELSGRFLRRLVRVLGEAPELSRCEQGGDERLPEVTRLPAPDAGPVRPSEEQQQAVDVILRVATGHRRRPVVLISDRGRGKSAAFGFAAAELMRAGRRRIVVTAPRQRAVEAVFEYAQRVLPGAAVSSGMLQAGRSVLEFVAPDELLQSGRQADLLLVDEAAAIPGHILRDLLRRYPRIAFATTVHGYEGTGRGFTVRFSSMLDRYTSSWKTLRLETPIRWAHGDPLERLVFRLLLLDASAAPDEDLRDLTSDECHIGTLDREWLADDERMLSELFGLLVLAHYRTRPLDLRHLLDGPNLSVQVVRARGRVVATCLTAAEGGFDAADAHAIWTGEHRPHGHLLPETLAAHQGLKQAPVLHSVRIMRIAVHPAVQGQGIGSRLVAYVVEAARRSGADFVGSSFGATPELLGFWKKQGWLPVRLGIQRGASSGEHSAMVLLGLREEGSALVREARERFLAQFPHQLGDSLRDLETGLVVALMQYEGGGLPGLSDVERGDLEAFAFGQRQLEVIIASAWRCTCLALTGCAVVDGLSEQERSLLIGRVLQRRSWKEAANLAGLTGRKESLTILRRIFARLLENCRVDQ